jgi:translation elongation factor EF-1alpha
VQVQTIYCDETEVGAAKGGENLRLRLTGVDEDDVQPGFVVCDPHVVVPVVTYFEAQLQVDSLILRSISTNTHATSSEGVQHAAGDANSSCASQVAQIDRVAILLFPSVCMFQPQILELLEHTPIFSAGYKCILHIHSIVEECECTEMRYELDPKTKSKKKVQALENLVVLPVQLMSQVPLSASRPMQHCPAFVDVCHGHRCAISRCLLCISP